MLSLSTYPANLTDTCSSRSHRMKMSLVGDCQVQTREVASAKPTVAVVYCHWQRPEACPECEPAVDRWLRQFAECGDRGLTLSEPLSLVGQGPCRSSSSAMPTLPRQGPSDETARKRAAKVRNSSHRLAA
jgi:hypothetical protein